MAATAKICHYRFWSPAHPTEQIRLESTPISYCNILLVSCAKPHDFLTICTIVMLTELTNIFNVISNKCDIDYISKVSRPLLDHLSEKRPKLSIFLIKINKNKRK